MKLITFADVQKKFGNRSRAAIYVDMKERGFPKPLKIGKCNYWDEKVVDDWIIQKMREAGASIAEPEKQCETLPKPWEK